MPLIPFGPVKESETNSADPDQTPHDVASDKGLQCLLTVFSIKDGIIATKWTHIHVTS